QLDEASFKEISGIQLNHMQLSLDATDKQLNISNLNTKLNNNVIKGDLKFNYPSLAEFIKMPEQSRVTLNLPSFIVSLKDLFLLQPNLKKNEYLKTLSEKRITGNIKADGYLADINLSKLTVNWNNTKISAKGNIQN